jgi:hypothetical protein
VTFGALARPALLFTLAFAPAARSEEPAVPCRFVPPPAVLALDGCNVLFGDLEEECEEPAEVRVVGRRAAGDFFVRARGPAGSGRFWTLAFGLPGDDEAPAVGFVASTSTVGWRNTPSRAGPLVWSRDLDGDGRPELLFWSSFPLVDETRASNAEFALVAWVYRLAPDAPALRLDWELTRAHAAKLARVYRDDADADARRALAASALERLASAACAP